MARVSVCVFLCLVACSGSAGDGDGSGSSGGATSGEPSTGDTTAATSAASAPTEATGRCGDGIVDPGEACDDGNYLDNDACTVGCVVPVCDDGKVNGAESDVDCGGTCAPCGDELSCYEDSDCQSGLCSVKCVGLFPTCLQLHLYHPSLPDGEYFIDPDEDGTPTQFFCNMVDGGWTEVARDALDTGEGWSAGTVVACGMLSTNLLGGAGQFGMGASAEKSFTLLGVAHKEVRVVADVIIIDSWESESIVAEIDGQSVASAVCSQGIKGSCGISDSQCGGAGGDGHVRMTGTRELPGDAATVRFSSTLDQGADDEAWGLDTFSLQVK